jgi:hypothetical protein
MNAAAFNVDYGAARAGFLKAAKSIGTCELGAFEHPERGPCGEPLFMDIAWFGATEAPKVLVLASGIHGVEGYCGSAAQIDWMNRGEHMRLPVGCAALLIHAVNPYGFAWSRRVTHENVDLNRNFIDFDAGMLPENPGYDEIASFFLPPVWTPESPAEIWAQITAYGKRRGVPAMRWAHSGQHRHEDGIFFGGREATWSRRVLTAVLQGNLKGAEHVGVIDYHTGIGPSGYGEIIITAPEDSPACTRARSWFGAAGAAPGSDGSSVGIVAGPWALALGDLLPRAEVTAIALEFGTAAPAVVAGAVVADNWLYARGDPQSAQGEAIRASVHAAFNIDDDVWRGMILGQSLAAERAALAGLCAR